MDGWMDGMDFTSCCMWTVYYSLSSAPWLVLLEVAQTWAAICMATLACMQPGTNVVTTFVGLNILVLLPALLYDL